MDQTFFAALQEMLKSKKFLAAVGGIIVTIAAKYFGVVLDPGTVDNIIQLLSVYIVGQGVADFGKSRTKIVVKEKERMDDED